MRSPSHSQIPDSTLATSERLIADLQRQLADCRAERDEALRRETATAEVLDVINSSHGDLAPVFDAILEKALRLCEAVCGQLATYDQEAFEFVALKGDARWLQQRPRGRLPASRGLTWSRIVAGEPYVHILDALDTEAYRSGHEGARDAVISGGRTFLTVALRREQTLLGALTVYRQQVRPFSDKQIALLQNFAAQAVIAMENARLLTETREALERQTATAEILRVISSSPTDVQPTFDAIAAAAKTLTDTELGGVLTYDGKLIHFASAAGCGRDELDKIHRVFPISADRASLAGRAILMHSVAHVADITADTEFHPSLLHSGGRTALAVPMLRDGVPIGAINVQRRRVERFSDAQIDLLKMFADQAVIAIENVRLFNETREAFGTADRDRRGLAGDQLLAWRPDASV